MHSHIRQRRFPYETKPPKLNGFKLPSHGVMLMLDCGLAH